MSRRTSTAQPAPAPAPERESFPIAEGPCPEHLDQQTVAAHGGDVTPAAKAADTTEEG